MQAGYVHPENQAAFQSGALRSIDISTLDRTPRVIEPRTREIYRGLFAGTLLAVFAILVLSPLYAALFYPDRLDNVLKVSTWALAPTVSLLGAIIGFYFGTTRNR